MQAADDASDADGFGEAPGLAAGPWTGQLRLARARALAAGVTVHWDRLNAGDEERQATMKLRDRLLDAAAD